MSVYAIPSQQEATRQTVEATGKTVEEWELRLYWAAIDVFRHLPPDADDAVSRRCKTVIMEYQKNKNLGDILPGADQDDLITDIKMLLFKYVPLAREILWRRVFQKCQDS